MSRYQHRYRLRVAVDHAIEAKAIAQVEIPEGTETKYFQKYAHMVAERAHGAQIVTRAINGVLFISLKHADL